MLQSLHVKNLALIDEAEVDFTRGLNILSGETGAGKSIIIGSINLALGEKVQKEMLIEDPQTVGGGEHTGAFPHAWRCGDYGDGKRECARDARDCKKQKIGV